MEKVIFKIFKTKDNFYKEIASIYQKWNESNKIDTNKRTYETSLKFKKEYESFLTECFDSNYDYHISINGQPFESENFKKFEITRDSLKDLFRYKHIHYANFEKFDYSFIPEMDYRKGIYKDFIHDNFEDFSNYYNNDFEDWKNLNNYSNATEKNYYSHLIETYKKKIKENKKKDSRGFKNDNFLYKKIINKLKENKELVKQINDDELKTSNIDLSDTKTNEKIIMFEKLGIIDFLRTKEPFNLSNNLLASVLSGLTGEKQNTIQSYINPMINKDAIQKNNPLNKAKTVNKVVLKLNSIGFKI